MTENREFSSPFIRSGPNKGKIRESLVAQETANSLMEEWNTANNGKVGGSFYNFLDIHSNDRLPIVQAYRIVKLERQKTKLRQEMEIDGLTGLLSPTSYKTRLTELLEEMRKGDSKLKAVGVIRFDLDFFSWVNDYMGGHLFGDLYLTVVADILRKGFRPNKDLVFRAGGDEFAAILPADVTPKTFHQVAKRAHDSLIQQVLTSTLQILLVSRRNVDIGNGKFEREGTLAFKEILRGMLKIRKNKDKRRSHFNNHARGNMSRDKKPFLDRLDARIDELESKFNVDKYLNDERVIGELNADEITQRDTFEKELAKLFVILFGNLSVSTGGIYLTQNQVVGFEHLDRHLDQIVDLVKVGGGGQVRTKDGLMTS